MKHIALSLNTPRKVFKYFQILISFFSKQERQKHDRWTDEVIPQFPDRFSNTSGSYFFLFQTRMTDIDRWNDEVIPLH